MVLFYKKWKKYNKIQLTKNKMDLNIRKMTNHPPSSGYSLKTINSHTLCLMALKIRKTGMPLILNRSINENR